MAKSNFNFNVFAEKEKLKNNGSNFTNWFRNLRIILAGGQKDYVLEKALGNPPATTAPADEKAVYQSRKDDYGVIKSTMLFAMEPELQNSSEDYPGPFEILEELKIHVAKYAIPREIEFRDDLPKTLVGKVAYRRLEEEANKMEDAKTE